jgi:predicted nucleic acid-binding protein
MIRAFFDTSVILNKIFKLSKEAEKVFSDPDINKYTNEYVLKELYHVLKKQFNFSEIQISYALDYVRNECTILPTPKKENFIPIKIRDKADKPIVCSAYKHDLILYIDDEKTYQDAKKYVQVVRIAKDK